MFRPNIRLYNLFKNDLKLPDAKAEEFVTAMEEKIQVDIEDSATKYKSIFKEDITSLEKDLRSEIKKVEMGLRGEMSKLEVNLRGDMTQLEMNLRSAIAKLEVKIIDSKIDAFKWMMLIVYFALVLLIIGLYIKK